MRRHPITRAGRLAPVLTAALLFPETAALAQNTPAGPPPAPVPAAPDKAAVEALKDAAVRPATDTEPAPAPTVEPAPAPASEPPPELPAEPLPEPPPLPASLTGGPPDEGPPAGLSEMVVINLISKMVDKGLLTRAEAVEMIQQAEAEAEQARAQAKASMKRDAAAEDDALRVNYVPEVVKNQMRDEIKQQLLAEMRTPGATTAGSGKGAPVVIEEEDEGLFGDLRIRYEMLNYDDINDNTGSFPNFHAINTGAPFDTAGNIFSPQYNVDQDRDRYRLRFRIGADYELEEDWKAGFRIATGENTSPVTTNQSMGLANQGAGGNFSKYAIWLDRAFMRWDHEWDNGSSFTFNGGRFDNPYYSTEIIFDEDLGFDGLSGKWKGRIGDNVKPFVTAGAYPIFNTDLNFSSNRPDKFDSSDKFLFAAQAGADFKLAKDLNARLAVAYYSFDGVEGKLSTPYTPVTAQDAGDTDNTRPSFAQRGNTYRPLRQIIPDATNNFGTINQWQYYGLATDHKPLAVTAKIDWDRFEPVRITAYGEYIKNLAYDSSTLNTYGVNNRGPSGAGGAPGAYEGSDHAWIAGVKVGKPALDKRGDWQALFNYRWVGSDAVIDAFTDSEFGGGGTNVKGWTLGAQWALSPNTAFAVSWLSSDAIAGPPLKSDSLQVDFKIKF
jgi:opacity protein-like surface antigen